jgi:ligand-binding SRPBCC domain-containing protein
MEPDGAGGSWLVDHIEYELPLGAIGNLVAGRFVRNKIDKMFDYRHAVTKRACEGEAHAQVE